MGDIYHTPGPHSLCYENKKTPLTTGEGVSRLCLAKIYIESETKNLNYFYQYMAPSSLIAHAITKYKVYIIQCE